MLYMILKPKFVEPEVKLAIIALLVLVMYFRFRCRGIGLRCQIHTTST